MQEGYETWNCIFVFLKKFEKFDSSTSCIALVNCRCQIYNSSQALRSYGFPIQFLFFRNTKENSAQKKTLTHFNQNMWSLPQSPPASRPHISIITNVGGLFSSSNKDGIIHELDISRKEKPCKWEAVKVVWKVYQLDGLEKACSSTLITRRNEALSWHHSKQRGCFSVIFSSLSLFLH